MVRLRRGWPSIPAMMNFMPRASNQGSKVAQPPHVEICDKQRPFGEGYGVRSQKAHQNSQVHHNTSAGLSQAPSGSKEGLGNSLQVVGEVPCFPSSLPDTNHAFKPFVSTRPVFHLQFDNLILVCVQNFCNFISSNFPMGKLFRPHYVQKINISSANLESTSFGISSCRSIPHCACSASSLHFPITHCCTDTKKLRTPVSRHGLSENNCSRPYRR